MDFAAGVLLREYAIYPVILVLLDCIDTVVKQDATKSGCATRCELIISFYRAVFIHFYTLFFY
jgi:hypothetical protein